MSNSENRKVFVHTTPRGWPLVGITPAAIVEHILAEKSWQLEPWQARMIAARLETLASDFVRRAAEVEHSRCRIMGAGDDKTEPGVVEANLAACDRFVRVDKTVKGEGMPAVMWEGGEA